MLDRQKLLEGSRLFKGPLGLLSFFTAKALRAGGAPEEKISIVVQAMKDHFPKLSEEDCKVLGDVLSERFTEER